MDKCVLLRELYINACANTVDKFDCKFYKRIFDLTCGPGPSGAAVSALIYREFTNKRLCLHDS